MTDMIDDQDVQEDDGADEVTSAPTGRRRMLVALAGAAAAGVAGSTLGRAGVAEAADGGNLVIGQENTSTQSTVLKRSASGANNIFTATDGNGGGFLGHFSAYPAGVGGFGYGLSNVRNGVYGWSTAHVDGTTSGYGVVAGIGNDGRAPLRIFSTRSAKPNADTIEHAKGEITVDSDGSLWACVADGTPGVWRKLAGTTTSGAFHPIDPVRSYDSRQAAYASNGILGPNASRVVSVADAHNAAGAVTTANVVPVGATAVTYNLTVAAPTGSNFLAVTAGDAPSYTASSINFNFGQNLANGLTGKLDGNRQLKVFCGDNTGSTHFIIDVNGYYL